MTDENISEKHYLSAKEELDLNRNEALWIKSLTLAEGDEAKAKYKYISLRCAQLSHQADNNEISHTIPNESVKKEVGNASSVKRDDGKGEKATEGLRRIQEGSEEYRRLFALYSYRRDSYSSPKEFPSLQDWLAPLGTVIIPNGDGDSVESEMANDAAAKSPPKSPTHIEDSFIGKLIGGKFGYGMSFWGCLILPVAAFYIITIRYVTWLSTVIHSDYQFVGEERTKLILFCITVFFFSIYIIASSIGLWRAATAYNGNSFFKYGGILIGAYYLFISTKASVYLAIPLLLQIFLFR